jgi:hypothetical protein
MDGYGYGIERRVKNGPALGRHGVDAVKDAVAAAITTQLERLRSHGPGPLRIENGLPVYLTDLHSPWQRSTNEIAAPIVP